MDTKYNFWAITLLCLWGAQAAVIPNSGTARDSYENAPFENDLDYANIADNLVDDESELVRGLYPPKPSAEDYYKPKDHYAKEVQSAYDKKLGGGDVEYVIDTSKQVVQLNSDGASQETRLKPEEQDEIKKLSAAFADLFANSKLENYDWESGARTGAESAETSPAPEDPSKGDAWKDLNPVIKISKSGVTVSFAKDASTEEAVGSTEDDATDRALMWDTIAKTVDGALADEIGRRLNMTEDDVTTDYYGPVDSSTEQAEERGTLTKFIDSVWSMMRSSIDYIRALFDGPTSDSDDDGDASPSDKAGNSTVADAKVSAEEQTTSASSPSTVGLFALDEPTSYHRFPSEESEKRGGVIGSLLYGYGII